MNLWLIGADTPHSERLAAELLSRGFTVLRSANMQTLFESENHSTIGAILVNQGDHLAGAMRTLQQWSQVTPGTPPLVILTSSKAQLLLNQATPHIALFEEDHIEKQMDAIANVMLQIPKANILSVGPLVLNRNDQTAKHAGKSLNLTEIEFEILWLLSENKGRVVSNTRLLSQVWGLQHDPQSNRVAVYMRRLRAKLPEGSIQTQRATGYRLFIS